MGSNVDFESSHELGFIKTLYQGCYCHTTMSSVFVLFLCTLGCCVSIIASQALPTSLMSWIVSTSTVDMSTNALPCSMPCKTPQLPNTSWNATTCHSAAPLTLALKQTRSLAISRTVSCSKLHSWCCCYAKPTQLYSILQLWNQLTAWAIHCRNVLSLR